MWMALRSCLQGTHGIYFPMLMAFLSPEKSLTYVVVNHDKSLGFFPTSRNHWQEDIVFFHKHLETGGLLRRCHADWETGSVPFAPNERKLIAHPEKIKVNSHQS